MIPTTSVRNHRLTHRLLPNPIRLVIVFVVVWVVSFIYFRAYLVWDKYCNGSRELRPFPKSAYGVKDNLKNIKDNVTFMKMGTSSFERTPGFEKAREHQFQISLKTLKGEFVRQWSRVRRTRMAWEDIIRPCANNMDFGVVLRGWGEDIRTSASASVISHMDVRPAGEFSKVFIESRTPSGVAKRIGGDDWLVLVQGNTSTAATVIDHDNGTYEAVFLVMDPGKYRLAIYLDYTLCQGLTDPPFNWFIIGNSHGKFQEEGVIGRLNRFFYHEPFNLTITVPERRLPEVSITDPPLSHYSPDHKPSGTLWIYGDSLAVRLHGSMASKPICTSIFSSCRVSYNWIYPVGNEWWEKRKNDDKDFNSTRVLNHIRSVLSEPSMKDSSSLMVLNIGLHYSMAINFTTYQSLIDELAEYLQEIKGKRARVVWKSTTMIHKEKAVFANRTMWRFFTDHRVRLFNAYATWAMCQAGVPVIDVYPLTVAFPGGTSDVVHYRNFVFDSIERRLAEIKLDVHDEQHDGETYYIRSCLPTISVI
ncbi:uncharacterized protein LOC5511899 isoform X2 [Nematostella vectensis]|uniref:uncharacterized protein LOC5511899 isoform X2 n=1 Tax=Nematostella vectensis TaxID=45351 RepID=UPI00138FA358|nr:uncharacterized protein LOC5511899 isoform X2 [Nematostella vectensis]